MNFTLKWKCYQQIFSQTSFHLCPRNTLIIKILASIKSLAMVITAPKKSYGKIVQNKDCLHQKDCFVFSRLGLRRDFEHKNQVQSYIQLPKEKLKIDKLNGSRRSYKSNTKIIQTRNLPIRRLLGLGSYLWKRIHGNIILISHKLLAMKKNAPCLKTLNYSFLTEIAFQKFTSSWMDLKIFQHKLDLIQNPNQQISPKTNFN